MPPSDHARLSLLVPILVLTVALGCGETSLNSRTNTETDGAVDASSDISDASPLPSPGCSLDPLAAGNHDYELDHAGSTYAVRIHVPPSYRGDMRTPVVLNLHGANTSIGSQQLFTAMNPDADARGHLVVYPGSPDQMWNAGGCCGTAAEEGRDDVGFVRALLEDVANRVCIDPDRVYATGHSNGGLFANRLACEASDLFAAIAPVSGTTTFGLSCDPERAVPILAFHGTEDIATPYDGNERFEGVVPFMESWATRDGCTGPSEIVLEEENVTCRAWTQCRDGAEVQYCTIEDMGHCWPGQLRYCSEPLRSDAISANEAMFDFFERFTRALGE